MISTQDRYLAGIVTGEQLLTNEQFECCLREGVLPLATNVEPGLEDKLKETNHRVVATELAHQRIVETVLNALGEAGVDCLVFKGTALAYSLYEQPWQRSRGDTDLWVREDSVDAAFSQLKRLGFEQQVSLPGRLAFGECAFKKTDEFGVSHSIDMHWRFNSNWMLTAAADFEELWRDRVPLPALGENAWTCTNPSALLISCVHRGAHLEEVAYEFAGFTRFESDYTLWLYDIYLLSGTLTESDWRQWTVKVIERGFAEFAVSGLERSGQLFGSRVPENVMVELAQATDQLAMRPMRGRASREWQSFRALGWQHRAGFIRQQLFPDSTYMRDRYAGTFLPVAYLKRLVSGVVKRVV